MSGCSSSSTCPNCGHTCDVYTDWKPFDYTSYECLNCGLVISPKIEYMTLEQLNNVRLDYANDLGEDYEPLTELPEQTFDG